MADNVAITPGTGATVAADDIGGVLYQRVKPVHGADGSATDVSTASPMPVSLTNLEKAEDAAHSSGHLGVMALSVRQDTTGPLAGSSGDYNPLQANPNGELRAVVGGYTTKVSASKTRPSDTTAYAAGDVLNESTSAGTVFTLDNCARYNAGTGVITGALIQDSANQSTKAQLELWLFSVAPTSDNDNAVFTPTDSELDNLVGVISFPETYVGDATSGAGGNCVYSAGQVNIPFSCAAADDQLYGVVVVRNAYTPVSAEVFRVSLLISQD